MSSDTIPVRLSGRPDASGDRGQLHEVGAAAITAVHRLLKIVRVHAVENDAVRQASEHALAAVRNFAGIVSGSARVTFSNDMVFVHGQLLRASRTEYETAAELGKLLDSCGASELVFEPRITVDALIELSAKVAEALLESRRDSLKNWKTTGLQARRVQALVGIDSTSEAAEPGRRVLSLYANAVAIMRQFYASVDEGATVLPHRVKRLAQSLVSASAGAHPMLAGLTTAARADSDPGSRSVQTALLALLVARELTRQREPLGRLALAALMSEVGPAKLRGADATSQATLVPATSAAMCLATGGASTAGAVRAVLSFESAWMEHADTLGPVYAGRGAPLVSSQVLHAVRHYLDLVAPRDATVRLSPPEALAHTQRQPSVDDAVCRILAKTLGVLPTGTVVELSGGEWAVVVSCSADARWPVVKVVTDSAGVALPTPRAVDLAKEPDISVRRVLKGSETRFNPTSALAT